MKILPLLAVVAITLFIGCGVEFATRYDRIEDDRVRTLAFVYDNNGLAEGAPGDTVHFSAYFSGEEVSSVEFTISTSLVINQFGNDTFADTVSFDRYIIPGTYKEFFGGVTDSLTFDFIVPKDIIRKQFSEDETIGELLPPGIPDTLLTEEIRDIKPLTIITTIESFSGELPDIPDSAAQQQQEY
jgi:hypothetical protein